LRKLAAILLWGLFLFNWVGYRALHAWLQDQATRRLEATIDKDQYQLDQLLHLKVPTVHLSYYTQENDFERVTGRIDVNGVPYQYVARRIVNDSAEYLCLPNRQALSLRNSQNNYYSLVNDLGSRQKEQKGTEPYFFGDPYELPRQYSVGKETTTPVTHHSVYILRLPAVTQSPAEHPPDSNA
jgi:hypothetical protein